MLRYIARSTLMIATLVVAAALQAAGATPADDHPKLVNAAPSIDDLVGRFLEALRARDRKALHALRVTKDEYVDLILPGSVPQGAPLRDWPAQVNDYYWSVLHTKSTYYEADIVAGLGGHHYTVEGVAYRKGTQTYATYTAHKQLALTVRDEDGNEREIRTGSIAEVNGRYKFISFIRD